VSLGRFHDGAGLLPDFLRRSVPHDSVGLTPPKGMIRSLVFEKKSPIG